MLPFLIIILKIIFCICTSLLFALALWAMEKEGDQ